MDSSQLHLPSIDKGQLEYYYQTMAQQAGSHQYPVPPSEPGHLSQDQLQYYSAQLLQQTQNQGNNHSHSQSQVPASEPPPHGTRTPSQLHFLFQTPWVPYVQPERRRPWYMWAIGVVDIIASLLFTVRVVNNVVTEDRFVSDRDTLMWTFFLMFLSLCVQFLMGVGLLVGLKSDQDGTTFWYCQSWICGAYFLFGETGFLLSNVILKLQRNGDDIGAKLLIVSVKMTFRVVSFILVRRFMRDLRGKSQYRLSATEIEQYQQHRLEQMQQLQEYQQEQEEQRRQQHQRQLQQQQYLQQQESGSAADASAAALEGVGAEGRRGTRGSECYYYAPQMTMMMNMMMNNAAAASAAASIPT